MRISNSGRVIVIDDRREEVLPLMETLSKNNIPYMYFDGRMENLPDNPTEGVRFVFLDIELQGMNGQDDKTKASGLTERLRKIISDTNGPYVIVFWTKHSEVIDQVLENCEKISISPVEWLDLEKTDCLGDNGSYEIETIAGKLNDKLSSIGAFRLYVEWENILHSASKNFIRDFSGLVHKGDSWSKDTSTLFYRLYKAYVEKSEISDSTGQFRCACLLMNRSFSDVLENDTHSDLQLPTGFVFSTDNITEETKAKINSSLFICNNPVIAPAPGCVYVQDSISLKESILEAIFKKDKIPDECALCQIVVTPVCDLAQNKTLTAKIGAGDDKCKIHRIVSGIMFPVPNDLSSRRKKDDAQFDIGPFWHDGKIYQIIVHFAALSYIEEKAITDSPLLSLKQDLLFDLQSKGANHVNRLGNFQL